MTPLEEFLRAWLDWREGEALDRKPFAHDESLCFAARRWACGKFPREDGSFFVSGNIPAPITIDADELDGEICDAMNDLFEEDGLSAVDRFGSWNTLDAALTPERLAWVRKTIARLASEREAAA